ncbi:MAG: lysozyme inhibitor LprI family protein [Leptolyngbya sp. BL-A-14]
MSLDRFLSTHALSTLLLALASAAVFTPLLATRPAAAAQPVAQQPNCNNAQTQTDMNICSGMSYETADRALNRTYQALLPKLSASRRQKLADAQLQWIKFRDTECDFYGSEAEGGTMQPMLVAGCKDQITQQRTADFTAYSAGKSLAVSSNYKTADQRLNQRYQQLLQRLEPSRKQKLETAELAWIAFRDSACSFEASGGGNAARNQCLTRLTVQRNQQLQGYLAIDR